MGWEDVSYLVGSPRSRKILVCLSKNAELMPKQIAEQTGIERSNVSTKLLQLVERKLVECVNPKSKKFRFYRITRKGKETLKQVENIF